MKLLADAAVAGMKIPRRVLKHIDPLLRIQFRDAVRRSDWVDALICVSSQVRISLAMDMFLSRVIPFDSWAPVLARAISSGDLPCRERQMLVACLERLHRAGRLVVDGERAREVFASLPERVMIHRGTVAAEGSTYGVCWTMEVQQARWFATEHGRFRNTRSPPGVLTAQVNKADICGVLIDRAEDEVLIVPDRIRDVTSVPA